MNMLIDLTHHSLSFPLAGNLSLKKDCGQAAMTEESKYDKLLNI